MKKIRIGDQGFGLIEVLVAVSILAVLLVGFSSMFVNQLNSVKYLDDLTSKTKLTNSIQSILADATACGHSLENIAVPAVGKTQDTVIKDRNGVVVYSANQANDTGRFENLAITSITLQNLDIGPGDASGRVSLSLALRRLASGGGPSLQIINNLEYRVGINPGNRRVTSCLGSVDELLEQFQGIGPQMYSDFDEHTLVEFQVDRLKKPARLAISVGIGGSDVVWGLFQLYRDDVLIRSWADGTAQVVGARVTSSIEYLDSSLKSGPTKYKVTVKREQHPTQGTQTYHIVAPTVLFEQR